MLPFLVSFSLFSSCLIHSEDISPPQSVKIAMDLQAEAERRKRASILQSEGEREADINVAQGQKQANVLLSEAKLQEQINAAKGMSINKAEVVLTQMLSKQVMLLRSCSGRRPRLRLSG